MRATVTQRSNEGTSRGNHGCWKSEGIRFDRATAVRRDSGSKCPVPNNQTLRSEIRPHGGGVPDGWHAASWNQRLSLLLLFKLGVDDVVVSTAGGCSGGFRFGSALGTGLFVQSGKGFGGLLQVVDG